MYGDRRKCIYFSIEYDYSQFDFEVRGRMLFSSPPVLCSVTIFALSLVHLGCV
jgi:hypothetical protein